MSALRQGRIVDRTESRIACEQALRWGLARDSRAQAVNRVRIAKRARRGLGRGSLQTLAPENLARDPNGELARRLKAEDHKELTVRQCVVFHC